MELAQPENWRLAKEHSCKRFFIPVITVNLKPSIRELTKLPEIIRHEYQPYFKEQIPSPSAQDPDLTDEEMLTLQEYVPTREMTVTITSVNVNVDFGIDSLSFKLDNIDIANKTIMYQESFTRAIYKTYDKDTQSGLEFYTDVHWKLSVECIKTNFSSFDILSIGNVVLNLAKKIHPVFWPSQRTLDIKAFINRAQLLVNPLIQERLMYHVASLAEPDLMFTAKAQIKSSLVITMETLNLAYANDVYLEEKLRNRSQR